VSHCYSREIRREKKNEHKRNEMKDKGTLINGTKGGYFSNRIGISTHDFLCTNKES